MRAIVITVSDRCARGEADQPRFLDALQIQRVHSTLAALLKQGALLPLPSEQSGTR